jgi:hypothetical protein
MQEKTQATTNVRLPGWYLPVMIGAAIVAAVLSEVCTNANKERFFTPEGLPPFPPELLREIMWNNIYNHSICFGFLGAVTCGLLTMITASLAGRAMLGLVLGSVSGSVVGALLGVAGYFLTKVLQPMNIESILTAMIIFTPLWGLLGLLTSITSMCLLGRSDLIGNAIQKSIIATVCTVLIFPLIVTIAFPTDWPGRIIQEFPRTRLVCYGVGAIGMACALFFALRGRKAAVEQVQPETNVA